LALLIFETLVLMSCIQAAGAQGTIYIRSDGSIDPPMAPVIMADSVTYVLSGNITGSIVVERNNIVLKGGGYVMEGSGVEDGITLLGRSNVTVRDMILEGFHNGIYLNASVGNTLYGNNVTNSEDGIGLDYFSNNNVLSVNHVRARALNNSKGVWLTFSSNNVLSRNEIETNGNGVELWFSSNNTLSGNNVTANKDAGVHIWDSNGNRISHNNMLSKALQVYTIDSNNTWDDGYPSGGSYWSDYTGTDSYIGPFQNESGSDGIGDTPYVIDANNRDRYPLMNPHTPQPNVAIMNVSPFKTVVGLGYSLNISATAANPGDYPETCNVTVYANNTKVEMQPVMLETGTFTTMTFMWNTTGFSKGNWTISAYAEPVLNETYVADNKVTCIAPVHVGVPGDISGPTLGVYDGKCDMRDISYLIIRFNSKPNSANWNANADVNNDGVCNMRDIAIAIVNFNKHE